MRAYILALIYAGIISLLSGTGWYTLFGYDPFISAPENIISIYTMPSFWRGFLIWTLLYFVFITLPITYLREKAT